MLQGVSRDTLSHKTGMTIDAARILAPAFAEDELSLAARLRAMAGTKTRPGLDVHPWYQDGARFGILTREEAMAIYRESSEHHLVTRRERACTDYLYLGREGKPLGNSCLYYPGVAP